MGESGCGEGCRDDCGSDLRLTIHYNVRYNVSTMYICYNVRSVCLDLRLTSKGGAGCFLSSPAAADDPPTCICIHPGGTHVNTNTSWWHTCKYKYILVTHM